MTEKEMIAAWEKQQKKIKESLNPRKNTLETWTPHNYSVEPLSEEESLHFAQMINPDYVHEEVSVEAPTREELDGFAAMIDADTKAILKHPDMQPQAAMEREAFMRK